VSAVMKDISYFKFIILIVSFSYFWLKPWFHVKIKLFYRILKRLVFYFNMEPCLKWNKNYFSAAKKLECGPMPNVMVDLPNIGGALC